MDPNETLAIIRNSFAATDYEAAEEAFEALDEWLSRGGFLPKEWYPAVKVTNTSDLPIHKANPHPNDATSCLTCGQRISRIHGGQGPTWIHADSGAIVARNPH